jgi:hypothetical protein
VVSGSLAPQDGASQRAARPPLFDLSSVEDTDAAEQEGCRLRSLTLTSLKHGAGWAPRRQPLHVIRNANPLRAQRLEQRSTQIVQYGPNPEGIS